MGRLAKRPSGRGRGRPPKAVKVENIEETDKVGEAETTGEREEIEEPVKSEAKVEESKKSEGKVDQPENLKEFEKLTESLKEEPENGEELEKVVNTVKQEMIKDTEKQEKETEIYSKPSRALKTQRVVKAPRIVKTPRAVRSPRVARKVSKTEEVKATQVKKAEKIKEVATVKKITAVSIKENKKAERDNLDHSSKKFSAQPTHSWQRTSSSYRNYGSGCSYYEKPENQHNSNPYPLTRCLDISYHELDEDNIIHIEVESESDFELSSSSSCSSSSLIAEPLETEAYITSSSAGGIDGVTFVPKIVGNDNGESASSDYEEIAGVDLEYTKQ